MLCIHQLIHLRQVDDLDAFAKDVAAAEPAGTPLFMGGQSMGGLIAIHEVPIVE